jgi:hypothetical protein
MWIMIRYWDIQIQGFGRTIIAVTNRIPMVTVGMVRLYLYFLVFPPYVTFVCRKRLPWSC